MEVNFESSDLLNDRRSYQTSNHPMYYINTPLRKNKVIFFLLHDSQKFGVWREKLTSSSEGFGWSTLIFFDSLFFFFRPFKSFKPKVSSLLIFKALLVGAAYGKDCLTIYLSTTKGWMVRTRLRATSPGHQESRDVSSNPHRDRQLAPVAQPSSVQHIQSMATAMTELTPEPRTD